MPNNTTAGNQQGPEISSFRLIIANVIGELRAAEVRNSFVALSLEELVDDHIAALEKGASTNPLQPTRGDRLEKLYTQFKDSIEAMKEVPPEAFIPSDPSTGDQA